ncbi:MAG: APC family permease, partial [Deltaproteobacteria bacterium]|nr:APC family permease [Deltaproteobacteria bacterium]
WLSFILSAILAGLTGLSYAELTARYPFSGGAAVFVKRAFPGKLMGTLVGVTVLGTGITSGATITVAFSHYFSELTSLNPWIAQLGLLTLISFLSYWGIQESSQVNFFLTFAELSGLLLIIIVGAWLLGKNPASSQSIPHIFSLHDFHLNPVLQGMTLAFYAYIGFEDLANLAEESKNPVRDLPRAILLALGLATLIYILVTLSLQIHIDESSIKASTTPLLLVLEKAGLGSITHYFSILAILAITNTGLINLIMASRLSYGMAQEKLLPGFFAKVSEKRKTPWVGVLFSFVAVVVLILTADLVVLAKTVSFLILLVFLLVHLSLFKIKLQKIEHQGMKVPIVIPFLGVLATFYLLLQFDFEVLRRSLFIVGLGFFVWLIQNFKKTKDPDLLS